MNTELQTIFDNKNFDELAAATGANISNIVGLPSLKINRSSEDDSGRAVPVGTYFVTQDGVAVYSKQAKFRPFLNTYQYMVYDAKTNTFPNKSIIIKNFNEQAIDESGGIKCGKVSRKEIDELVAKGLADPAYVEAQRAIKCYRGLYGLVSFESAVDADGNKTSIINLPVLWRMSGDNFMSPQMALNSITKIRHICFQHMFSLGTERKKQGSNVYYISTVDVDLSKELVFTEDNMATFALFQEYIDNENKQVAEKWRNSKRVSQKDDKNALFDLELNDDVDDL